MISNIIMQIFQSTTVSWSVDHGSSTMDLLTLDNMTFSGDSRFSVVFQNPTDWALVIEKVEARDAGKYICSLETFPKQSLMVYLQVDGESPLHCLNIIFFYVTLTCILFNFTTKIS